MIGNGDGGRERGEGIWGKNARIRRSTSHTYTLLDPTSVGRLSMRVYCQN